MSRKFLSSLVLVLISIYISAQQIDYTNLNVIDYKKPKEYIIKDINVTGIKYLDENILVSLSGLSIGEKITVPGDDISNSIQKFWEQGLFSDVKISIKEQVLDSIKLEIYLQERNRISELEIIGLKKSQDSDIREKLELKKGMQVTENLINNAERIIKDYLFDKKYLNCKIDIVQVDDTVVGMNNVKLRILVDKGEKVKIQDIKFAGNLEFSNGKLKRLMKETKKQNLNFFKGSKYVENLYIEDKKNIIKKYNSKGYRDAEIVYDTMYYSKSNRLTMEIEIFEGKQYFFRNIDWVGNTKYTSKILDLALRIDKGDPYDPEILTQRLNYDEDALSNLYLDNGYLFFNVNPTIQKIENDSIDLQMRIFEGDRFKLNKVIIRGNSKTNEHIVRRELRTTPGDLFSKTDIMRSQREVAQLGFFDPEQFGIEPINIDQIDGKVDLEYTLFEKSTDQFEVSGGWGAGMFVGTLGIRFNNFSARQLFKKNAWRPIPSGDGQSVSLRAQTNGKYYSSYSFSFVEPWFGGKKPNSFSISLYYSIQKRTNFVLEVGNEYFKTLGMSVGLGQRLKWPDDFFTISNSINYQNYNLNDWSGFVVNNGSANNLSISTTFARNSVDAPIYPRSGSSFALTLQITPPYSLFKEEKFWELSATELSGINSGIDSTYSSTNFSNEDWFDVLGEDNYLEDATREEYIRIIKSREVDERESNEKYKWVEYHKWKYKGAWYVRLWKDMVLAANTEFGYVGYFNNDIGYTPFGRFNMGGDGLSGYSLYGVETVGLRGYENGSITPLDENGQKAGNVYEKINFELRYPISLKPSAQIYVLAFAEGGNAWRGMDEYNPFKLRRSAGIGLRAFLPMFGLLGIDWGYGFDEIPGNKEANGSQFHFVIGQQF